jgi:hypothetical protein
VAQVDWQVYRIAVESRMPLNIGQAIEFIVHAYPRCVKEDIRTPKMREALHLIMAHFPAAKPHLVELWYRLEYQPQLKVHEHAIKLAPIHRTYRIIERKMGLEGWYGSPTPADRMKMERVRALTADALHQPGLSSDELSSPRS